MCHGCAHLQADARNSVPESWPQRHESVLVSWRRMASPAEWRRLWQHRPSAAPGRWRGAQSRLCRARWQRDCCHRPLQRSADAAPPAPPGSAAGRAAADWAPGASAPRLSPASDSLSRCRPPSGDDVLLRTGARILGRRETQVGVVGGAAAATAGILPRQSKQVTCEGRSRMRALPAIRTPSAQLRMNAGQPAQAALPPPPSLPAPRPRSRSA